MSKVDPWYFNSIDSALEKINYTNKLFYRLTILISLINAALYTFFTLGLYTYFKPLSWQLYTITFSTTFIIIFILSVKKKIRLFLKSEFITALELKYPAVKYSLLEIGHNSIPSEWRDKISDYFNEFKQIKLIKIKKQSTFLLIPLLLSSVVFKPALNNFHSSFKSLYKYFTVPLPLPSLEILQGPEDPDGKLVYKLDSKKNTIISLISPNLLEVKIVTKSSKQAPQVKLLTNEEGKLHEYQSFKMYDDVERATETMEHHAFKVSFAVNKNVALTIPSVYKENTLARIHVKEKPKPLVKLKSVSKIGDFWPDEKPLLLNIEASSTSPLKKINLIINVADQESSELVHAISAKDILDYKKDYSLLLEPYINSDITTVEIRAEVIDSTSPVPMKGYSEPIFVKTASAYGRYKRTLNLLNEIKQDLDSKTSGESKEKEHTENSLELAKEAVKRSRETPYFDHLDRIKINHLEQQLNDLDKKQDDINSLMKVRKELIDFLVEHEILDDRERDRDFFVAIRAYSYLLERLNPTNIKTAKTASDNLIDFLKNRHQRWKYRISILSKPDILSEWKKISEKKPFITSLSEIEQNLLKPNKNQQNNNASKLSILVTEYRNWIEQLEAAEDDERQEKEQERQKGLASIREKLRELQKKQGKISSGLDQSKKQSQEELNNKWPLLRLHQNTNMLSTKKLEYKIRALAPKAGGRIKAAVEAMSATLEKGEDEKYVTAESFSDLAGRLLRQAEKESTSNKKDNKRRKRRRVTGDSYYGQSVHGGDIEINREYQVDKKYREDVLEEIQNANKNEEDAKLLESYLRKIIR